MASPFTRRRFLQTAGTRGALLGLGDLSAFLHLNSANAAETKGRPWEVRYGADIEPLVRLIEETPEEKCIEVMAERLRNGQPGNHRRVTDDVGTCQLVSGPISPGFLRSPNRDVVLISGAACVVSLFLDRRPH